MENNHHKPTPTFQTYKQAKVPCLVIILPRDGTAREEKEHWVFQMKLVGRGVQNFETRAFRSFPHFWQVLSHPTKFSFKERVENPTEQKRGARGRVRVLVQMRFVTGKIQGKIL